MKSEVGRRRRALLRRTRIEALGRNIERPWRPTAPSSPIAGDARFRLRLRPSIGLLWAIVFPLVAVYAAHRAFGLGGSSSHDLFDRWLNDGLLWIAAIACLFGALRQTRGRAAWLLVALALASWATGDTIWSIRFGDATAAPPTSISDVFWLAWYPLVVVALVLLVRDRVAGFDLHRWIDGIAVMLIVATPWVGLFLEPVTEHARISTLARALDFTYPLADAILVGAAIGVFALQAWRPSRMWVTLGIALLAMGISDALYSLQAAGSVHDHTVYDVGWVGGACLVAFAAWEPHPGRLEPRPVTGFSAIVLPVTAQLLAAAIQMYAFFYEIPRSERIMTVIVLLIATLQIVLARPRKRRDGARDRSPP